jgi:signal peptidase
MPRSVKRIWNIVSWALVLCVVALAVLLGGIRLIGLTPYTVLSGSMEPAYPVGSLIYVKAVPPEQVEVGDPITFRLQGDQIVGTHRVIAIDPASQHFTTKGDANNAPDASPVPYQALIGIPVFCVPYLGYVSGVLTQPPTMYLAWSALAILILLIFLPDLLAAGHRADEAAAGKAPKITGKSR